jgi:fibronectin-binding autotransporter adhesin
MTQNSRRAVWSLVWILLVASVAFPPVALMATADAASATWSGASDALWATLGNWNSAASVPGAGETATFNATSSNTTVNVGTGLSVGSIVFDTANAASYTIGSGAVGSQTLTLTTGATANAGVTTNQTFNANVLLGTATAGTYTFTNSATSTLTLSGTVQGGTGGTAGAKTLNIAGSGPVVFNNVVGAGGGTNLSFSNTGSGTVTLSGAVSSSLNTLRATGNGWAIVDGQTVTVAAASSYGGGSTTNGKFELRSGSVAFNGGISFNNSVPDGSLIRVSGGSFSASTITLLRTGGGSTATATTAAQTGSGFVVTSGSAVITGVFDLAGSNSNATALVSGGAMTVAGEVRIGNSTSATGRFFIFQVSGGTLTSTDATNGIVVARSTNAGGANNGSLLLTGGTTTAEKISFGVTTTASGAAGTVTLNGTNAALYLGSGGIVKSATNAYTTTITLTAGLLGAKSDWSSSLDMTLNGSGTAVIFNAADASGVAKNISLSGGLSGAGGFAKAGAGNLTLSGINTFTGAMGLGSGTLAVGNASALGSGTNSLTVDGGTLNLGGYAVAIGTLLGGGGTISSSAVGATLSTSVTTSSTYAGAIADGAGTVAVTKAGAGALTLSGVNTYTGNTTISLGTLEIGGAGQLGGGSYAGTIANAGAFVHSSSAGQTLAGAISGAGSFTKSGAGTVTLTASNSYTGSTTVSSGTLALSSAGALASTGTVGLTGSTAVFDISGASGSRTIGLLSGSTGSALLLGSNGLAVGNATAATFNGQITGSGVLTKVGVGSLTLTASNTGFTGGVILAGGTTSLGGGSGNGQNAIGAGPIEFQNGAVLNLNGLGGNVNTGWGTLSGTITIGAGQSGTLNMFPRGNVTSALVGSGTFNVNVDYIRDDFSGNWSGFTGTINLGATGDFRLNGTLGQASGNFFNNAKLNVGSNVSVYQIFNPPSTGGLETIQAVGELSGFGVLGGSPIGGRSVLWSVGSLNTSSTFAGRITDSSGVAKLTKVGTETLTLSGSNSYTGLTAVQAGVLRIGDGGTTGLLSGSTSIAVSSGAMLAFNRSDNYGGPFSNVISGSGGLRIASGILELSAMNTYTGTTSVLSGATLTVNGRLANAALNVAAGATLMGSGTIAGLTTVAGIHSPGNSPGIETFTNLTYETGASVNWELWGNTASNSPLAYDQVVVTSGLTFAGSTALNLVFTGSSGPSSFSNVDWNNAFWNVNQEWQAYSVSGSTTGFSNLTLSVADWLDANGASFQTARPTSSFSLEQRANGVYVVYAIVPEPAGFVLAAIGGGVLAWRMIRRRSIRRERG